MRYVIYRNSILATICSMTGSAFAAVAVVSMIGGELGILEGIGVLAASIGLMWLASFISERKERKKQEKAARAAQSAAQRPASSPAVSIGLPVKKRAVYAGLCFLLAAALSIWAFYLYRITRQDANMRIFYDVPGLDRLSMGCFVEAVAYFAAAIACLRTKSKQSVCGMFYPAFVLLIAINGALAVSYYGEFGFASVPSSSGIHHMIPLSPMLKCAAGALMFLLVLLSRDQVKARSGGAVRGLFALPALLLAPVCAKSVSDSYIIERLPIAFEKGVVLTMRPEYLEAFSLVFAVLAMLLTGLTLRRLCAVVEPAARQAYAAPAQPRQAPATPQRAQAQIPCPHCSQLNSADSLFCAACGKRITAPQSAPAQPQPTPVQPQSAPAQPRPTPAQPAGENRSLEVEKQIKACKDLLDCGILTREEYEAKILELTRG